MKPYADINARSVFGCYCFGGVKQPCSDSPAPEFFDYVEIDNFAPSGSGEGAAVRVDVYADISDRFSAVLGDNDPAASGVTVGYAGEMLRSRIIPALCAFCRGKLSRVGRCKIADYQRGIGA